MSSYVIRYVDRASERKAALPAPQRTSLDDLEKLLIANPFGPPAVSNRDDNRSAGIRNGFITYVVSSRHVVVNVIDLVAL
ncbi:hypothetical protein [Streptomyces sp. AC512_CC834]|uniref:hypothetical protein n=1 Tax=Streptomyces sp. AC512_CC834 TaxID=2823691 RepID=UPI001C25AF6A|nr:hypothetical protein [Streptomyces sp. AC512_CC834]